MIKGRSTRELVRGEHGLAIVKRGGGRLAAYCAVIAIVLGAALSYWLAQHEAALRTQMAQLEQEKAALLALTEELEMSAVEATATHAQLERRNAELVGQVRQLKTELAFFRQQKR